MTPSRSGSLGALGGGGSILTVPALVYAAGQSARAATTESLVIVGITCIVAAVSHAARAGNQAFHWSVIIPFTAAAIAGSLGGKRVADKVPGTSLTKAFVALLFAVAAYVAIRSGVALAT